MTTPLRPEGYEDAMRLASSIRVRWLARGYVVQTSVEYEAGSHPGKHGVRGERINGLWTIRSDMVNGLPVRRVEEMAA